MSVAIVVAGRLNVYWGDRKPGLVVARYLSDGSLDQSFGDAGLAILSFRHYVDGIGFTIENIDGAREDRGGWQ